MQQITVKTKMLTLQAVLPDYVNSLAERARGAAWRHDLRDDMRLLQQMLKLLALLSCFAVVPHTVAVDCSTGMTVIELLFLYFT